MLKLYAIRETSVIHAAHMLLETFRPHAAGANDYNLGASDYESEHSDEDGDVDEYEG